MPLFNSFNSNNQQNVKLSRMNSIPTTEDLRYALAESKRLNKPVELPFENNRCLFIVTVVQPLKGNPRWSFQRGEGPSARVLWTRESTEVLMIQNKIKVESAYDGNMQAPEDQEYVEEGAYEQEAYAQDPYGQAAYEQDAYTQQQSISRNPYAAQLAGFDHSQYAEQPPQEPQLAAPKPAARAPVGFGGAPSDEKKILAPPMGSFMGFGTAPTAVQPEAPPVQQYAEMPPPPTPAAMPGFQNTAMPGSAPAPAAMPGFQNTAMPGSAPTPAAMPGFQNPAMPGSAPTPAAMPGFQNPAMPGSAPAPAAMPGFQNPAMPGATPGFQNVVAQETPAAPGPMPGLPPGAAMTQIPPRPSAQAAPVMPPPRPSTQAPPAMPQLPPRPSVQAPPSMPPLPPSSSFQALPAMQPTPSSTMIPGSFVDPNSMEGQFDFVREFARRTLEEAMRPMYENADGQQFQAPIVVDLPPPIMLDQSLEVSFRDKIEDPRTGLAPFDAFHFFLLREITRCQLRGTTCALVIIEIAFIDEGQIVSLPADSVVEAAERILSVSSPLDMCTQITESEFAVLLPHSDSEAVTQYADLVHRAVVAPPVLADFPPNSIMAAIGIAVIPETCNDAGTLIAAAEMAKELAKSTSQEFVLFPR
ncbi:MAG: diguanylate cyclase [Cyanobacteria bacterium]|nr:diguanylate cyclase [Cyanobacteriota bacterium]